MGFAIFKKLKSALIPRTNLPTQADVREMEQTPTMQDVTLLTSEISRVANRWMVLTKDKYFDNERQATATLNNLKGYLLINLRKYVIDMTPRLRDISIYTSESHDVEGEVIKSFLVCVTIYTKQGYVSTVTKNLLVFRDGSCTIS